MAQETFSFALNLSTNAPEIVRVVTAQLDVLRRSMGLGLQGLKATGDLGNIQTFLSAVERAARSGANLETQLRQISSAYAQLAASSPRFAAAFDIGDFGRTLEQRLGIPQQAFEAVRKDMLESQRGATEMANAGVAGFSKVTDSVNKSNEAIQKTLLLYERLRLASSSVARASTQRARETPQDFIARAGGVTTVGTGAKLKPVIDTGDLENAVRTFEKRLNLDPIITKLRQQGAALKAAAKELEEAGDPRAAARLRTMAATLSSSVAGLQARQNVTTDMANRTVKDIRYAQDSVADAMKSMAATTNLSGLQFVKAITDVGKGLQAAGAGDAFKAATTNLKLLLKDASEQLEQVGRLRPGTKANLTKAVEELMASAFTGIGNEFGVRAAKVMQDSQRNLAEASRFSVQAEKEFAATRLDSSRATKAAAEDEKLLAAQRKQAADAVKAAARAQSERDKTTIGFARPDITASTGALRAAKGALDTFDQSLVRFNRATTDAGRQTALNAMTDSLGKFDREVIRAAQSVSAARQTLAGVSPAGQNERGFQTATAGLDRVDAELQALTGSSGRAASALSELTAAEQRQQQAIKATADLKKKQLSDELLLAESKRRQGEASTAANNVARLGATLTEQVNKFNAATKDTARIRIGEQIELTVARIVAAEQAAVSGLVAAQAARGLITPEGRSGFQYENAGNVLTETEAKVTAATNRRKQAEDELVAVSKRAAIATQDLADAEKGIGQGSFFQQFKTGFSGVKAGPEVIGQTARISLLYGTAYRLLGVISQVAADAFQTLTEFQVGLSELGSILSLSSSQVKAYGESVLSASAATGTAADDLLKATERVSLVTAGAGAGGGVVPGGEEQVRAAGETATSLGQLSLITKQTADQMATYTIAIAQATGMTGDFVRTLGDQAAYVSKLTGAPTEDLLKTVAQIGDLGNAVGLTTQEMLAMAGNIQVSTGQTADAVAGYLTQILARAGEPAIQQRLAGAGVDTSRAFGDQLKQLATLYQSGTISSKQATDIANAFGRGRVATALLAYLRTAPNIASIAQGATTQAGGTLSERASKALNTFAGQISKLRASFERLITTVGLMGTAFAGFLVILNGALTVLNALVTTLSELQLPDLDILGPLGGTNAIGDLIALWAAFRIGKATLGFFSSTVRQTTSALSAFRLKLAEQAASGAPGGLGTKGSAARGRAGGALTTLGVVTGGVAGVALAGVTAVQAWTAKVKENNEAVKAASTSLKGLNSDLGSDIAGALNIDSIRQAQQDAETTQEEMNGFWDKLISGEARNRIAVANSLLEAAAKTNDTSTQLFIRAVNANAALTLESKPEDFTATIRQAVNKAQETTAPQPGFQFTPEDQVAIAQKMLEDGFANATTAIQDALQKGLQAGAIDLEDGLSADEMKSLVDAAIGTIDTSQMTAGQIAGLRDVFQQLINKSIGDVNAALLDKYKTASKAVADAAKGIDDITSHIRGITFRTPLFSKSEGISGAGNPIPQLMDNLATAYQNVVTAEASGVEDQIITAREAFGETSDKVQQTLASAMQVAELTYARNPKSKEAVKAFSNIMAQQIIATGGETGQLIALFANSSKDVVNAALSTIKAEYEDLKAAVATIRANLAAARNVFLTINGVIGSSLGETQRYYDWHSVQASEVDQKTLDRFNLLGAALDGANTTFAAVGKGIIGASNAAKETGDTAAQIAAAAELAEATRTGDKVQIATAKLHQAQADLAAQKKRDAAYYNALAQVYQAQDELAQAILERNAQARKFASDLTNPIQQAELDLATATAAVQDAVRRGKAASVVQSLQLEERTAANSLEETKFREFMAQLSTNRELGRITDQQYVQYLEAEKARLSAIAERTYQQQQQLDEVEKALKAAAGEMDKQFNLGDIKLPTVYQVRRYIQTMTAGLDFLGAALSNAVGGGGTVGSSGAVAPPPSLVARAPAPGRAAGQTIVNNQINIDGADIGMVKRVIIGTLGATEAGRVTTLMKKY